MDNTGYCNTGYRNTGYRNTGNYNTGDYNTGNYNTGDYNTGYRNTGDRNTGNRNTGNYNTGNYNTGDCNTGTPKVRLFNCETNWEFSSQQHLTFRVTVGQYLKLKTQWVYEKSMSKEEKEDNPTYKTTGGYLKVNGTMRSDKKVSEEDRKYFEGLPNFDADILFECTGIDLREKRQTIEIAGKTYFKDEFEDAINGLDEV